MALSLQALTRIHDGWRQMFWRCNPAANIDAIAIIIRMNARRPEVWQ